MSAASYYDKAAAQDGNQQPGPMQYSGATGYNQESHDRMHEQQQRGYPQQASNGQGEQRIYNGQEPQMGNSNYAQGAQQTGGQGQGGAQGAVADDRDTLTKCNDNPPDYKKKTQFMPWNGSLSQMSRIMLLCSSLCY